MVALLASRSGQQQRTGGQGGVERCEAFSAAAAESTAGACRRAACRRAADVIGAEGLKDFRTRAPPLQRPFIGERHDRSDLALLHKALPLGTLGANPDGDRIVGFGAGRSHHFNVSVVGLARNSGKGSEIQKVNARRLAAARMGDAEMVKKLFDDIGPRFANRNGGYTRMFRLGPRLGDAAEMVVLELVED